MTIDPMAAVTSATSSAGSSAAGADSVTSMPSGQAETKAPAADQVSVDQNAKADLFDYTAKQQNTPPAIETLRPEAQADYLSNPAALGEKVLQRMEGLHQRSIDYHDQFQAVSPEAQGPASSSGPAGHGPAGGSEAGMSGPATEHVAGSATSAQPNGYSGLKMMFDYAIESTMISKSSSQFVSSVNTLLKGQ